MFAAKDTLLTRPSGGYQISRSLRFNSADSAYLNRTPASATNRRTWTWSAWVKRSALGAIQELFDSYWASTDNGYFWVGFTSADAFEVQLYNSTLRTTTQVFRDPSAWYHLVLAIDTTQATAANRVKVYLNGSEITTFSTNNAPTQNLDTAVNYNGAHYIGTFAGSSNLFNGYMTEVNLIDGTQLTPSSFGETNAQTGVWQPKAYSGSYGTNGFYLNFSDNSNTTAATLGKDYSGNGNNWTPNNFSVTAGAGNDSLVDSPTSYGTDTGVGGTVRGNYCTLNALQKGSTVNIANGNLDVSNSTSGGAGKILGTIGVSSGKWYAEATMSGSGGMPGISEFTANLSQYPGGDAQSWGYNNGGQKYHNGSGVNYGATFTTNDVIGIALDMDTGSITFYKNNVSQGVAYNTGIAGKIITFAGRGDTTTTESWNFGQRAFAYTAPSGFKALCTQNLPTPTVGATTATQAGKYFNTVLYTGTGSSLGVTGVGFQPDWVWAKGRSGATDHALYDAVRGVQKQLESNTTTAETTETTGITAFGSDGFTTGALAQLNTSSATYVAWNWKANGAGSTNTAGSITSTVSANTTSGFSVVTYTGNGTSGATIGHGLGVAPSMVIVQTRTGTNNRDKPVYHVSVGNTGVLTLNDAIATQTSSGFWNNTTPSSTVITLGNDQNTNQNSSTYVAYCFAPIEGYSAFGSYTGNGSADGPFVFTNFQARWLLIKRTDSTQNWFIWDTSRSPSNVMDDTLEPNLINAENLNDSTLALDVVSNGFKIKTTGSGVNTSSGTYIYMAFASNPFKYSLAR